MDSNGDNQEDFVFGRKSKADKAKDAAAAQARHAGAVATDLRDRATKNVQQGAGTVSDAAGSLAHTVKDRYGPRAEAAAAAAAKRATVVRDKAVAGIDRGIDIAAPKAESAVANFGPKVDTARDKIVDDVLPKLQELLHNVQSAKDDVLSSNQPVVATITGKPKKKKRKGRVLLALGVLAVVGAGVAHYLSKQQQPANDPWATPTSTGGSGSASGTGVSHSTGTTPEAVTKPTGTSGLAADERRVPGSNTPASTGLGDKASDATDTAKDKSEDVADDAKDAAARAKGKASDVAKDAADSVSDAAKDAKN